MKILLTGAGGFIGSLMGPYLQSRGHAVTGLDTGFFEEVDLYPRRPIEIISKDTRDVTIEELVGFDAVVHLAELSNDPLGNLNRELTFEINHKGTVRLAKLSKQAGAKRFIHSSSCSIYGMGEPGEVKDEFSKPIPLTAYAECKMLVEEEVSKIADADFCPTFLRNATVYGPSPRMRFDLVLNNLSGLAWTTKEIALTSDGSPWRPLVHVEDLCLAFACVLESPVDLVHNEKINVGKTEENYQIREVAEIVSEVFPGCSLSIGQSDGDNRSYRVSFDKIAGLLPGFKPAKTLTMGAVDLREIFEEINLSENDFKHRNFTRLKQLTHLLDSGQINSELYWNKS